MFRLKVKSNTVLFVLGPTVNDLAAAFYFETEHTQRIRPVGCITSLSQ